MLTLFDTFEGNAPGGQLDNKASRKIGRELRDQTYSDPEMDAPDAARGTFGAAEASGVRPGHSLVIPAVQRAQSSIAGQSFFRRSSFSRLFRQCKRS
jgi:hypothetical protein